MNQQTKQEEIAEFLRTHPGAFARPAGIFSHVLTAADTNTHIPVVIDELVPFACIGAGLTEGERAELEAYRAVFRKLARSTKYGVGVNAEKPRDFNIPFNTASDADEFRKLFLVAHEAELKSHPSSQQDPVTTHAPSSPAPAETTVVVDAEYLEALEGGYAAMNPDDIGVTSRKIDGRTCVQIAVQTAFDSADAFVKRVHAIRNGRAAYTAHHTPAPAPQSIEEPVEGAEVSEYVIDMDRGIRAQKCFYTDGKHKWAIRKTHISEVLNNKGEWEVEPINSECTVPFLRRTRFATAAEAIAAYKATQAS